MSESESRISPNEEERMDEDTNGGDWYVSGQHTRRAIGYLSGAIPELHTVEAPRLLEVWGEALEKTIITDDRSPIGAPPDFNA